MIEMQKKVAKLESQVKDINDDLNTVCDRLDEMEVSLRQIKQLLVGMTLEDEDVNTEEETEHE